MFWSDMKNDGFLDSSGSKVAALILKDDVLRCSIDDSFLYEHA